MTNTAPPLWRPDRDRLENSRIATYISFISNLTGKEFTRYHQLYDWSINNKEVFWSSLWDFFRIIGEKGVHILDDGDDMEKAVWFADTRLNYAENLLIRNDDRPAIYTRAEDKYANVLSSQGLYQQVASLSSWLRSIGVEKGDRVAGYLPNTAETVVAMLATTSIGAIWTSTSPDFGAESVIDRFGQTRPKVMFCTDGYYYSGKVIELGERNLKIATELDSLVHMVTLPFVHSQKAQHGLEWQGLLQEHQGHPLIFTRVNFNDPLCILYSSGTTGKPKCIVHKTGGVLLQHLKEHQLHCDIRPDDNIFYFTTCGWMMWNWLVSALGSRANLVLYDGSPFYPDANILWDYAAQTATTLFGTSAKYLDAIKKNNLSPCTTHNLPQLRTICSTGSVLAPESYDFVYERIKSDVCLSSISGGTDLISCFIQGCPILPVYRGECQCRGLGMAAKVFNSRGEPVRGEQGELVCTATFPSQPAFFWGDSDGSKYHNAYFARFDNVWYHGDYVSLTDHGTMIIYGRSDATLNPGGVRIGTAEIYRHVEQVHEVLESIVIGQQWQDDVRVVLFVVLRDGLKLTEELKNVIRSHIREHCSPRHVPAKIIQVAEIPRTKSGKIVELAVRDVVHNRDVENVNSLANPDALELYRNLPELQQDQ